MMGNVARLLLLLICFGMLYNSGIFSNILLRYKTIEERNVSEFPVIFNVNFIVKLHREFTCEIPREFSFVFPLEYSLLLKRTNRFFTNLNNVNIEIEYQKRTLINTSVEI